MSLLKIRKKKSSCKRHYLGNWPGKNNHLQLYRCSDFFAAATNCSLLNAASLLITKMWSKMLFDQFRSCRYKWRKLFRFHYVTVKNTTSHFPGNRVLHILHWVGEIQENSPLFSPFLQLMQLNTCGALGHCFPMLHCIRNRGDKWDRSVWDIRTYSLFNHN